MSAEMWSLVVSLATLVVLSAAAVAALVQLRHLRLSNQLSGLLAIFSTLENPSIRDLINYVRHDLSLKMKDEGFRKSLLQIPIDRSEHPEFYLCDIYQHIGSFVRSGLIDEGVYLQTEWYNVTLYWSLLSDVVRISRTNRPHIFENFEYLAARAARWVEAHPRGDYPSDETRML